MNTKRSIPHTVVAVCTETCGMLWIDGNSVPTATAFRLTCEANRHPMMELEADVASLTVHGDFNLDSVSAGSVLACISTFNLVEELKKRGDENEFNKSTADNCNQCCDSVSCVQYCGRISFQNR